MVVAFTSRFKYSRFGQSRFGNQRFRSTDLEPQGPITPVSLGAVAAYGLYAGGSTTFQDDGATTIANAGDPVAYVQDHIGGHHATTATAAERPVLNAGGYAVCDRSDDKLRITVPSGGWAGDMAFATTDGVAIYGVTIPAGSHELIRVNQPGSQFIGAAFFDRALSASEKSALISYYTDRGAGDFSAIASQSQFWSGWDFVTDFPVLANNLTGNCWGAWRDMSGLASFPALDLSGATTLAHAWRDCSSLSTFPVDLSNTTTGNFSTAFTGTNLTQASIDQILADLVAAGLSNGNFDQSGGSAPSAAGEASIDILTSRGWTVTVTGGYVSSGASSIFGFTEPLPAPTAPWLGEELTEDQAEAIDVAPWSVMSDDPAITITGGEAVCDGTQTVSRWVGPTTPNAQTAGDRMSVITYLKSTTGNVTFLNDNGTDGIVGARNVPGRYSSNFDVEADGTVQGRALFSAGVSGSVESIHITNVTELLAQKWFIILVVSQSNWVGNSVTGLDPEIDLPAYGCVAIPGVQSAPSGWRLDGSGYGIPGVANEPIPHSTGNGGGGPNAAMLREIRKFVPADYTPVLVATGYGGGGFSGDGVWSSSSPSKPAYDNFWLQSRKAWADAPAGSVMGGVVFCQGESDLGAANTVEWQSDTDGAIALLNEIRAEPGWGEMPIVISEIGMDINDPGSAGTNTQAMVAVQQKLATGSGDPLEFSRCAYVPRPSGWVLEADNVHYDQATNRQRGYEVARALYDLIYDGTVTPGALGAVAAYGLYAGGSTTFQDDGATTIANAGDPVAYVQDYIGGHHATTATAAERPVLNAGGYAVCDRSDDTLTLTVPSGDWTGDMAFATTDGVAVYGMDIPAGSYNLVRAYQPGANFIGAAVFNGSLTETEKTQAQTFYEGQGAGDFSTVTDFTHYWRGWDRMITFPLIDTSSGTTFNGAWRASTRMASFPAINTGSATILANAWRGCALLADFPLIDTALAEDLSHAWRQCTTLTSFPAINTDSATNLSFTWWGCTALADFPANVFDSCPGNNFANAFTNTALTETSIDNILASLVTAGQTGGTFDQSGGFAPSAAGEASIDVLVSRGWTVTVTGGYAPSAPAFTAQPTLDASDYLTGSTATLTLGTGPAGTTVTLESFTLASVDKSGELSGLTWDSTGELRGLIALQTRITDDASGLFTLSNVVTANLFELPAQMSAPSLAVDSDTQITVTLAADPDNGGSPITQRNLRYSTDQTNWTPMFNVTSPVVLTGLTAGTTYYVQTSVSNFGGAGAWSASASDTTNAASSAPSGTIPVFGPQSGDSIPLTVSNLSEDAPDSYWILTPIQQTIGNGAGALSSADVIAGDIGDGTNASDAGTVSLTQANPNPAINIADGLDDSFYLYLVLGDSGGNYSDPIEAGPTAIDSTVASGSSFLETIATASFTTSHDLVLTNALAAGTYLIGVANLNGASQISSVSLEGTAATQRGAGYNADSKSLEFHEVTIAGGGNQTVNVAVTSGTNRVAVTVWQLGGKTYQGEASDGPPHQAGPNSANVQFTTSAGDEVFVISGSNTAPDTTMTNLTHRADDVVVNGRHFNSGDNLNTTGGVPETFSVNYDAGFDNEDALGVHYA